MKCLVFQTKYKDSYLKNILGHYVGSYEDPYYAHCMKVTAQNSDVSFKTIASLSKLHEHKGCILMSISFPCRKTTEQNMKKTEAKASSLRP